MHYYIIENQEENKNCLLQTSDKQKALDYLKTNKPFNNLISLYNEQGIEIKK